MAGKGIGLAEAARLCGRNASSIHRAMAAGRLSFTVNGAGQRRIDPAELDRCFGINAQAPERNAAHGPEGERIIAAQAETIARQDATIADLRRRLDVLMAVLTDRRPWWRRWFR